MEELNKLKFKRSQIKGTLGRFRTFLDALDLENVQQSDIAELNSRLDKVHPLYDEFMQCQTDIEYILGHCDDVTISAIADAQKEGTEMLTFENEYFNAISRASVINSQNEVKQEKINSEGSNASSIGNISARTNISQYNTGFTFSVKLPEMKLPKFSGSFDKWLEFRDSFTSMIDKNASLDAMQKFYYLRAHLEGEAAQMIESIKVTELNYGVALSLLKQRYENNRLIIFNYVKALFEAPPVVRESYTDLRNLYDTFNKNVRSLEALGQPTDQWSVPLIYLLVSKFDSRTRRDWESYKCKGDIPNLEDVNDFLKEKCELFEKLEVKVDSSYAKCQSKYRVKTTNSYLSTNERKFSCFYCKSPHSVFKCNSFAKLEVSKRHGEANRLKLCLNCLNPSHDVQQCPKPPCRQCSKYINSLLHNDSRSRIASPGRPQFQRKDGYGNTALENETSGANSSPRSAVKARENADGNGDNRLQDVQDASNVIVATQASRFEHSAQCSKTKYALLSTAAVFIKNKDGIDVKATILLDPGSQSNFVSDKLCEKINVEKTRVNFAITGVGDSKPSTANFQAKIKIRACSGGFSKEISCLILPRITQPIPICTFDSSFLNIPGDIRLADPEFNVRKDIDILCGVGFFYDILTMNQIKLGKHVTLQSTKLGWIIGGEISYPLMTKNQTISCVSIDDEVNKNLIRFWEVEECGEVKCVDDFCETHFKENYKRNDEGRFVVKIPFKENVCELGNSKELALRRFELLEQRLLRGEELKKQYDDFMSEYERLGHMTVLNEDIDKLSDGDSYYLSHHAVVKTTSLTTRLRVVFNGSACTDNGLSLNDVQYSGPSVQNDLFSIVLNFRKCAYVLNADISKMYRQVIIHESDRRYQRIFWRNKPTDTLKCYEMNVVTYGLASSSYLATRCLLQLAIDNAKEYPLACDVIKNCFYVDDLLVGSNDKDELLQIQRDVNKILSSAGFELRKYLTNKPELFNKFDINTQLDASILQLGEHQNNKTLGVYWNSSSDTIQYRIGNLSRVSSVTKRSILSITSQIFDILGLLGPIIIRAKMILQMLWKEKLSWDEEVSGALRERWISFCEDLKHLNNIQIPRHVFVKNATKIELHAFADSSERSYGACVYIRCMAGNEITSRLIAAKSKVAPVRPITLPRLELTGAVLATRLAEKVKNSLNIEFDKCYYWSDSTVTLCWIRGSAERWKKFVSNRVSIIQTKTNKGDWQHVKSQDNPADLISRGVPANSLINNHLWFEGPPWLKLDKEQWPLQDCLNLELEVPEQRTQSHMAIAENDWDIFTKYSSLVKLKRVIAFCKRFAFNAKHTKPERLTGELSTDELNSSMKTLIKVAQIQTFLSELTDLRGGQSVRSRSNILKLQPFLDEDGIVRVGGRIQRANLPFSQRHPIILHNKHKLTESIMIHEHKRLLHCGPQQLLYSVRENFWPISGRSLSRNVVHRCVVCFRVKPKPCNYLMGTLPTERLNQCIPFTNTGCDYAGFFLIKDRKTRGCKLIKAYVCVFICMATKAIHLELVTSLSCDAFLSTLRRFIARRGKPVNIFSDNGTNFTGADSELQKFLKSDFSAIEHGLVNEGVRWHFIPPHAPNFGGLWEAGVKSFKHHLKRVVGNTNLDYEDFMTVLTQIEAILNSRPLSPMSSSPADLSPLTPGHFLIGRSLVSLPDPDVTEIKESRLNQYQRIQQLTQHFWRRWNKEYVSELQCQQRWKQNGQTTIQIGNLVVIKDDNLPPLMWKLGRVVQLFPGQDGITRVAAVKCSDKTIKRAISKICPLPMI